MSTLAWWPHTLDPRVASVRLRCLQVVAQLQQDGIDCGLYTPGTRPPGVLVLSKRYDEGSVRQALALREDAGTRLALDLCDNHFYSSNPHPQWKARAEALRRAVGAMDLVMASTPTLADYIRSECPGCPPICVVGDAVEAPAIPSAVQKLKSPVAQLQFARLHRTMRRGGIPKGRRLLWFGNHGSGNAEGGMADLLLVRDDLARAARSGPVSLTVISNSREKFREIAAKLPLQCTYLEWHASTFSRAAALHDIALIPVGRNPFTVCKTNNRVATAFVHGLAVVAHAIPSYQAFADSAVLDDWGGGLESLMGDAALRAARVRSGQTLIEADWGLPQIAAQWARALTALDAAR